MAEKNNDYFFPIGGICATTLIRDNELVNADVTKANRIQYCYNHANIISNSSQVGGVCGYQDRCCYLRNCKVASDIIVRGTGKVQATLGVGSNANGWIGKMVGITLETLGGAYLGENSLEITQSETVY